MLLRAEAYAWCSSGMQGGVVGGGDPDRECLFGQVHNADECHQPECLSLACSDA